LLALAAAGLWYFVGVRRGDHVAANPAPPPQQHLSIVVLPFANLSGDPAQDYFVDAYPYISTRSNPRYFETYDRSYVGLRKAGMPEQ
jgi:hypothetical protein